MKKIYFLIFISILFKQNVFSQLITKAEVYNSGYNSNVYTSVAYDKNGFVYTLTRYTQTYTIGNDEITMIAGGSEDMAITKYDSSGNYLWTRRFGANPSNGTYSEGVWGFSINKDQQIVFAMAPPQNSNPVIFEDTSIRQTIFGSHFLIKLDTAGSFISSTEITTSLGAMCVVGNDIYYCESGTGAPNSKVHKLKKDGTDEVILDITINGYFAFSNIVAAPNGDFLIYGRFSGTISAGNIMLTEYYSTQNPWGFVFRIDAKGNVKWGERYDAGIGQLKFTSDNYDNTYLFATGPSSGIWLFGNNNYVLTGAARVFLLKIDNTGKIAWEQQIYSNDRGMYACDIYCSGNNKVYLLGRCGIGGIFPIAPYITDDQAYYIAKLDSAGNAAWTIPFGGGSNMSFASFATFNEQTFYISSIGGRKFQCIDLGTAGEDLNTFCVLNDTESPTPKVEFNAIRENQTLYFENDASNFTSYNWNFGDGISSELANPSHEYSIGTYNACLTASNTCGVAQKCDSIIITGISKIFPDNISSTGYYPIKIEGGFSTAPTSVRFVKPGYPDIVPVSFIKVNNGLVQANLSLEAVKIGDYDLYYQSQSFSDTVFNALHISKPDSVLPYVKIIGPGVQKTGRSALFKIIVTNNSNMPYYGVPVYITMNKELIPFLITPEISDVYIHSILDTIGNFHLLYTDTTHSNSVLFGAFIIPHIQPGQDVSIDLYERTFSDQMNVIRVKVGNSYFTSDELASMGLKSTSSCNFLPKCVQCFLDLAGYAPGVGCLTGAFGLGCSIGNFVNGSGDGDVLDLVGNLAGTALSCAGEIEVGEAAIKNSLGIAVGTSAADFAGAIALNDDLGGDCGGSGGCAPGNDNNWTWPSSGAIDPNYKTGPVGKDSMNFINKYDDINYIIHCENVDTAKASAAEVSITDTLDANVYDWKTFEFAGFGFGDTVINFTYPKKSFSWEFDLRPEKNAILRVTGLFDTLTGIINWQFSSLDPITLDIVSTITDGFLNPNVNAPEGEAFVNYHVALKNSVIHLQQVKNKSVIIFDVNPPVITNTFLNTVDTVKPKSKILDLPLSADTIFTLKISGNDQNAGISSYDVYASLNDNPYKKIIALSQSDSFKIKGNAGDKYKFYSIAHDYAGNIEDTPNKPDAETIIGTVLPVTFLYFNVEKLQSNKVKLTWRCIDNNLAYTVVERSRSNFGFDSLASVFSKGNLEIQWIDKNPNNDANYYRLKFVDKDGKLSYSPIRLITFNNSVSAFIIPNPTKNTTQLFLTGFNNAVKITITDLSGKSLWRRNNVREKSIILPLQNFANGTYIVTVNNGEEKKTLKLVKEK